MTGELHKQAKGCVARHEPNFENPSPSYPNCAYRVNGYNEALSGSVTGALPPTSKRALYELDFTQTMPDGTPADQYPRKRLPAAMEPFKQTGRQKKADKLAGVARQMFRASDPRQNRTAWFFVGRNYKVWSTPFGHEYHHIMPEEALLESLSDTELDLLVAAEYNINDGKNIIILPITRDVAYALMLPRHKGWHSSYNRECAAIIESIRRELSESQPEHEVTEENKGAVANTLESWSDMTYWHIVEHGRASAKNGTFTTLNKMFQA
ncbi:MAG TPA: AHH domain-containing protein [Myxococcaceae bacterium]|nr:AHH domain-containing protein [Myxococcaceae bacterium]